jgi:hypothetical protein
MGEWEIWSISGQQHRRVRVSRVMVSLDKVLGDDEENVWIRQGGVWNVDPSAGERWLRLSLQDGSMTGIELPPGVEALRFREGHLVGSGRPSTESSVLVRYRLVGG